MGKIHLISSCGVSRKVVHEILSHDENRTLAVACKQIMLDKPGQLVLITIGTLKGHIYVFDIKRCKDIMIDGELWRILQSSEITKVMHDCRNTSAALQSQFNVILTNVFDTQAAYCMVMMTRALPPRFIHLHHLYEKFGDPAQRLDVELQEAIQGGGIFWAQRPLSDAMLQSAATDVTALIPAVYENLKGELSPTHDSLLEELCHAYIHGKFKVKDTVSSSSSSSSSCTSPRRQRPIRRLTESQHYLLQNTVPQSAGQLTYHK